MSSDNKIPSNFSNIGKVSKLLDIPQTVLRFWESQFPMINLHKINGRRYYDQKAISLIQEIKVLLYEKGYTIKGAQNYISSNGISKSAKNNDLALIDSGVNNKQKLSEILEKLKSVKDKLEIVIKRDCKESK